MSFGVMGGPMQAQGHIQMVVRSHLWKQNPQEPLMHRDGELRAD